MVLAHVTEVRRVAVAGIGPLRWENFMHQNSRSYRGVTSPNGIEESAYVK